MHVLVEPVYFHQGVHLPVVKIHTDLLDVDVKGLHPVVHDRVQKTPSVKLVVFGAFRQHGRVAHHGHVSLFWFGGVVGSQHANLLPRVGCLSRVPYFLVVLL